MEKLILIQTEIVRSFLLLRKLLERKCSETINLREAQKSYF